MSTTDNDEFSWLEDVEGKAALDWVKSHNVENNSPEFLQIKQKFCEILDSNEKIPYVEKGPLQTEGSEGSALSVFYNLWKDKTNKLGLWRRCTFEEYQKPNPSWETVLDLDELSKKEGKGNMVWHGAKFLHSPGSYRCLINLSRGGADADETREFDLVAKDWVSQEAGGFFRPESKGGMSWINADTVYVYTDVGPGSMTDSGYPRIVKEWKRGQKLEEAKTVYEGLKTDMYIAASYDRISKRSFVSRTIAFYNDEIHLVTNTHLTLLKLPNSANKEVHNDFLFLELRKPWQQFGSGSLIVTNLSAFLDGKIDDKSWEVLFTPTETRSLSSFCFTKNHVILNILENVKSKIEILTPINVKAEYGNSCAGRRLARLQKQGQPKVHWVTQNFDTNAGRAAYSNIVITPVDSEEDDTFFMTLTNYLTPSTLSFVDLTDYSKDMQVTEGVHLPCDVCLFTASSEKKEEVEESSKHCQYSGVSIQVLSNSPNIQLLKSLPSFFDASEHVIEQGWATSDDGTKIPYFLVRPEAMEFDSLNPTLLYGYGGFEVSLLPNYSAGVGSAWLNHTFPDSKGSGKSRKGVYVVANIRGGAEFGCAWHQAALKEKRHKAYEDFSSVARDLVRRQITKPKLLGCNGASNGGLLTGNMLTQYPQLFGAIVIQVPLLDMRRYHKLLAGASWIAEYGNPDLPEEWAFLKTFSPYHLLQGTPDAKLPPTLITTSTRDDRVHPGHTRKMVALMLKLNKDITYYENIEGGHGGAANSEQQAHMSALLYCFLHEKLGRLY